MDSADLGEALKSLRKRHRWTLMHVRELTGIPTSTLSRIENNQASPTYDMLLKLSRGLDMDIGELLSVERATKRPIEQSSGRRTIDRAGGGMVVNHSSHTLHYLANDLLHKQFSPILCEYRAKTLEDFGEFMKHPGEEFLYIVEGSLELHTECYAPVVLDTGDSIYFDSSMAHAYVARTDLCRALSVCTL